ncbi:MAG: CAP domain-containing protein [Gaiellaceae bacterium]
MRRTAAMLALVAGVLTLTPSFAASPATAAGVGDCNPNAVWPANRQDYADQVVQLVNQHRATLGLSALKVSPTLTGAAVWKARHMAQYGYMQHDDPAPPVARTWFQRVQACGYLGSGAGENIAYGYSTPQAVMNGWLNSPGHRANIENAGFRVIGVGAAGSSTIYWGQNFGSTDDSGAPPPPGDTTAPAAPANLTGSAPSSTQVTLSWSPSTDNVGVTGYRVYRGGSQIATSTTSAYTDNTALAGTTYSYTARAYDAAGNLSASSNTATVTTPAAPPPPPPPPPPGGTTSVPYSLTMLSGSYAGSLSGLANQDGVTFDTNPSSASRLASWFVRLRASNSLTKLNVRYVGAATVDCTQALALYDWDSLRYITIDTRTAGSRLTPVSVDLGGALGQFVSGTRGDGDVRVRLRCSRYDTTPFVVRTDQLRIVFS